MSRISTEIPPVKFKNAGDVAIWLVKRDPWASVRFSIGGVFSSLLEAFSYGALLPIIHFITNSDSEQNRLVELLNGIIVFFGLPSTLLSYLVVFGSISIFSAAIYIILEVDRGRFVKKLDGELRYGFLNHIVSAKWSSVSTLNYGDLINALTREMDLCRQSYHYIFLIFSQSLLTICFLGVMCFINPKFFIITFTLLGLTYPLSWPIIQWSKRIANVATRNASSYSDASINGVRALKNIKATSLENYFMDRFEPIIKRVSSDYFKNSFVVTVIRYRFFELIGLFVICSLLYLSIEHLQVPIPEVLVSLAILFRLIPTVSSLMSYISYVVSSLASFDFIYKLSEQCSVNAGSSLPLPTSINTISFQKVSFQYDVENKIVNDLTFTIKKGEFWAICGPTGSGKSTILDLCDKLLEPNDGQIFLNESDVNLLDTREVHRKIAYLTQAHYIFEGSIRENLLWGIEKSISSEEMAKVISLAQLEEFINIKTLDFRITESGQNLSGGERQRIALARTLLSDADFILMDEPSSALDIQTEKNLFQGLLALKNSIGLLVITHRPEFLQYADGVIHLEDAQAKIEYRGH